MWVAWWTAPPARAPFRKPDASSGGARSHEEALAEARRAVGGPLVEIEPYWAPGLGARAPRSPAVGRPRGGGRQRQRPRAIERPVDHGDDERRPGHHDLDLGDARHHRARNGRRPEARISSARSRHPPRSGRRCGGLPPGTAGVQGGPAPDRPPPSYAHPGAVMAMLLLETLSGDARRIGSSPVSRPRAIHLTASINARKVLTASFFSLTVSLPFPGRWRLDR